MNGDKLSELVLIYNSDKTDDREAKAFAVSLSGYILKAVDLAKESLTEEEITQLAAKMKVNIEDLLDPTYDDHISVHNEGLKMMCRTELLSLMAREPKIINTPVLIIGNRAYRYGGASQQFDKVLAAQVNADDYTNDGL
jgi:arsenate reductase-like glutaredoxin family protein